ncbi:MAG: NUDIX hydrolase [Nanoarchaeota archaeon]|nr:NUDIX hydrolase [Nanoarchaeota archaeon]
MVICHAVKALIQKDNKFLIIEQRFNNQNYLNLPGGKLQKNESEIDALHRELKEELSITVKIFKKLGSWYFIKETNQNKIICTTYLCELENSNIDLSKSPKDENITNYYWLRKEDLPKLDNLPNESLKKLFESIQELL